jgi:hypothetical protein
MLLDTREQPRNQQGFKNSKKRAKKNKKRPTNRNKHINDYYKNKKKPYKIIP